jgi:hypothetical protein
VFTCSSFDSIRKLVQWPEEEKLSGRKMLEFIEANWSRIVSLFAPENSEETYERLSELE